MSGAAEARLRILRGDSMGMNGRLRVLETNYGRDSGWYVEVDGQRVAVLTDPRCQDMFWDTYRLQPLTSDPGAMDQFYSAEFWSGRVVYRNCEFDAIAPH